MSPHLKNTSCNIQYSLLQPWMRKKYKRMQRDARQQLARGVTLCMENFPTQVTPRTFEAHHDIVLLMKGTLLCGHEAFLAYTNVANVHETVAIGTLYSPTSNRLHLFHVASGANSTRHFLFLLPVRTTVSDTFNGVIHRISCPGEHLQGAG